MEKHWSRHAYHFYDLDIESQEITLQSILEFANDNAVLFIDILHREDFNVQSRLHVFYEALARDMNRWSAFFLDELKRIFEIAESVERPNLVLKFMDGLLFADKGDFTHRDGFVSFLRTKLNHPHPTFRYHAVFLLSDFVHPGDQLAVADMAKLLDDPDWRVRHWTYQCLRDLQALPEGFYRRPLDMLYAAVFDTTKFT
jgi:hypothetical protein